MNTVSIIKNNNGFIITFSEKPFDAEYIDFKVADNIVYFVPGLKVWGNKVTVDKFGNCQFRTQANLFSKFAVKDRYIVKPTEDGMGCYIEKGKYQTVPVEADVWFGKLPKGGAHKKNKNAGISIAFHDGEYKRINIAFGAKHSDFIGKRLQFRPDGEKLYFKIDDDDCGLLIKKYTTSILTRATGKNIDILKPYCGKYAELIEDGNGIYHIERE